MAVHPYAPLSSRQFKSRDFGGLGLTEDRQRQSHAILHGELVVMTLPRLPSPRHT